MSNDRRKNLLKPLNLVFLCLYLILVLTCILLFSQGDLFHTFLSSKAYLNGNILDFYDYNQKFLEANDYLPALYILFAIWNLPLYLIGMLSPLISNPLGSLLTAVPLIEFVWAKIFIASFFFASIYVLSKISNLILIENPKLKLQTPMIFATAPIAMFIAFVLGQYDIVGVFFTLIGFYFYLKKDWKLFSLFFSIAVSFKFFAFVIYFPLILLIEKRPIHILKFLMIGVLFSLIEILIYWNNDSFRDRIFSILTNKVKDGFLSEHSITHYSIPIIYVMGCIYLFKEKFKGNFIWHRNSILACIGAYGLMLSFVVWHPQWVMITMPFFAMAYMLVKNRKLFAFIDLIGGFIFVWICINRFPNNLDFSMISLGVFREFIHYSINITELLGSFQNSLNFLMDVFHLYLVSPLLLVFFESKYRLNSVVNQIGKGLFFARFFFAIFIFIIVCLVISFSPIWFLQKINKDLYVKILYEESIARKSEIPIGEIFKENIVTQTFYAKHNGLTAISFVAATYSRKNVGTVALRIEDMNLKIIAEKTIMAEKINDNGYLVFIFEPIGNSAGKKYRFVIEAEDALPGNAITAWASKDNQNRDGELTFGGVLQSGDITMNLYYCIPSAVCAK